MRTRRTGTIIALLLTAALFLSMPGLARRCLPGMDSRADERLRPPRLRPLTVWLIPGEVEDGKLIRRLCTQFEKSHEGVRIFLRTARAEELYARDAILPDVLLFDTGSVTIPEGVLLPLTGENPPPSGTHGGVCYALPLWLEVNVLCAAQGTALSDWEQLLRPGTIRMPAGTALQQLALMCPVASRSLLPAAMGGETVQVRTLSRHLRLADGLDACVMTPAVSDRVRYIALCRDGREAQEFVLHMSQSREAVEQHLLPLCGGESDEPLMRQALSLYGEICTLPNAFSHSREGLESLCLHAFEEGADPVETLLGLR